MRAPRTYIYIPPEVAAKLDLLAGHKYRAEFIVEILEQEIMRREQLAALTAVAGTWKDEGHPELAQGGARYVDQRRHEDESHLAQILPSNLS